MHPNFAGRRAGGGGEAGVEGVEAHAGREGAVDEGRRAVAERAREEADAAPEGPVAVRVCVLCVCVCVSECVCVCVCARARVLVSASQRMPRTGTQTECPRESCI